MKPSPATTRTLAASALSRMSVAAGEGHTQKGRLTLPSEIIICPWGHSKDLAGQDVIVNETTLATLTANQEKFGYKEIALDFNHNTVPGKDGDGNIIPVTEPQPIAAMGRLSVVHGKGIIFTPLSWTPEGEASYTGRHYRDLSPTVGKTEKGEVNFIHSVALTRNGQIADLHAYSTAHGLPALTTLSTPLPTTTMENTAPDYKALLLTVLALGEDATDEQIIAASTKPLGADEKPKEETPSTEAMSAPTPDNVIALAARMDRIERDNLVAEATRAGKVIPLSADALQLTPLSVLTDMIAKLPAGTVPLTSGAVAKETPSVTPLSADEKTVCQRLGLTEDQYRAAK